MPMFAWPTPPFASYPAPTPQTDPLPCEIVGLNDKRTSGRLTFFVPEEAVAHVQIPPARTTLPLRFDQFRSLTLTTPLAAQAPAPQDPHSDMLGQRIAIEDGLHLAAVARRAADLLVLTALAELPEIGEWTIRRRHAGIVLLDPAAHLHDQNLLQVLRWRQQCLGVLVLGLEIGADVGIEKRRIAQNLLPLFILQPGIVVFDGDPVEGVRRGAPRQRRWRAGIANWREHPL